MIIDCHAHACGDYLHTLKIIQQLDANGVDKVILVPGELNSSRNYRLPELGRIFPKRNAVLVTNWMTKVAISVSGAAKHIDEGNARVHELASQYPERIIQFYWVSMRSNNPITKLEANYQKYKFKGIKLHQCWESFNIRSKQFEQVAEFAISNKLPLFIHPWSNRCVLDIIDYKEKHPELALVIAHLIGLEQYIRYGKELANLYFEVSSPSLISSYRLQLALQYVGAKRLLMGTDVPYGRDNLSRTIKRISSLNISNEDKELVLGKNIERLLAS
jgi:predicted TIM-barrel fold metal-dependent hydrolase